MLPWAPSSRFEARALTELARALGEHRLRGIVVRRPRLRGVAIPDVELEAEVRAERALVVGEVPARLVEIALRGPDVIAGSWLSLVVMAPGRLRWRESGVATSDVGAPPMLVLVGLETTGEPDAEHREAFRALLSRLDVRPAE